MTFLLLQNIKETTAGARKEYENMIKRLGEVLDPFSSGPTKNIKSGVLLDNFIVKGMLKSNETGEKHLHNFILKRVKVNENDAARFFGPTKNPKLKTEFELKVREAKAINQLKEDKQAFGLLVTPEEEVYSYPLITLSLAFNDPSGKLHQSQKALFRNYLISESKSTRKEVSIDADWIYDAMAVVRATPIKSIWKELANTFLDGVTPQEYLHPASIQIITFTYDNKRIKEMAQTPRDISGRGMFIWNLRQTIPLNTNDWNHFFNNGENKTPTNSFFLEIF